MNCFVASALGCSDVDRIYDRIVRRTLREIRVNPVRVDRVEHNEDIDDKICALIRSSDICIADLTYARPSVYYEAGYAFGLGKPVVYTVRGDHFTPRAEDKAGNCRVHFDLQMKNIIKWEPIDSLAKRLKKRLLHVVRPLKREEKRVQENQHEMAEFGRLSLNAQLVSVTKKGKSLLFARGFRERPPSGTQPVRSFRDARLWRTVNGSYQEVLLIARHTIPKPQLSVLSQYQWFLGANKKEGAGLRSCSCVLILASLRPLRKHTLRSVFPNAEPITAHVLRINLPKPHDEPGSYMLAVVDQIKSAKDFATHFRGILEELKFA